MSSPLSMPSIDKLDVSSGGVSRIAFITHCDLETRNWAPGEEAPSPSLRFQFPVCERPERGFSASLHICLPCDEDPIPLTEAEQHRLRCFLFVHSLPDAGLSEADQDL